MRKLLCLGFFVLSVLSVGSVAAAEYCVDQYSEQIVKVNSELGSLVKRQNEIDVRIAAIFVRVGDLSSLIAQASAKFPPDLQRIQELGAQINSLNREKVELEAEGFKNQDRVAVLKGVMPADLQGKLRGCVEATAPANRLVNLTIQTLAIISTGGLSLALPPKSLYVDMSAVLNGYPTGGDNSVINEAREAALKALPGGLGDPNNDFGRAVRDPGRILRCILGC